MGGVLQGGGNLARELHGLSTSYPQDDDLDNCEDFDQDEDLMDVPDLFEDLPARAKEPRLPQDQRTAGLVPKTTIRTKPGVILAGIRPEMSQTLDLIELRGDVITSGREGEHKVGSLHYQGLAVDVRWGLNKQQQIDDYIRTLGDAFEIVPEPTHIHIEYDPRKVA